MEIDPLQLALIPHTKKFPRNSDNVYVLGTTTRTWEEAKVISDEVREHGYSVRVEKDKLGKYGPIGFFILWVRVKRIMKNIEGTA